MTVQRKDLKKHKTICKNKKSRCTGKKTALKMIWYYKPWEAQIIPEFLFNADGIRYTEYLRTRDELRQMPMVKKINMLEVPTT